MKALIYVNKVRDKRKPVSLFLKEVLNKNNVDYLEILDEDLTKKVKADVLYVLGGDGTILSVINFACQNEIPIIAINTGKLGFLTEFEPTEIEESVSSFLSGELILDDRMLLKVKKDNNEYLALNDAVVQRIYDENSDGMLVSINAIINNTKLDVIKGDGVIIATPTGSTAYSLSAGGCILAPGINALNLTPISAHSLYHRPIVFSADDLCELDVNNNACGLFIDGFYMGKIQPSDKIFVTKSTKTIRFLRKNNYNFFNKVVQKMKYGDGK